MDEVGKSSFLFLTTANLAMKPRLVKEIRLAKELGSRVTLVSFLIENWTDNVHLKLCRDLGIEHHEIYATRRHLVSWFLSSVIHRFCIIIWPLCKKSLAISAFASNKRTIQLIFKLAKFKGDFNLANGRNTATLFPIHLLSKKKKIKFSFDIEDYHPGENVSWTNPVFERQRREFMMEQILPHSSLITVAGKPILNEVLKLIDIKKLKNTITIDNSFPNSEFVWSDPAKEKLVNLVWFSVDISRNRGLETMLPVLAEFKDKIRITLIGNRIQEFHDNFLDSYSDMIEFVEPMLQRELHSFLSRFDIGLAIEPKGYDLNKQLAVSNKLYAYSQAGLFVIATDTKGQQDYMEDHQFAGCLVDENNYASLKDTILKTLNDIDNIRAKKKERFNHAKNLSWEQQSKILLRNWNQILNKNW